MLAGFVRAMGRTSLLLFSALVTVCAVRCFETATALGAQVYDSVLHDPFASRDRVAQTFVPVFVKTSADGPVMRTSKILIFISRFHVDVVGAKTVLVALPNAAPCAAVVK